MKTFANTPKGRATLKRGDRVYLALGKPDEPSKPSGLNASGLFARLEGDAYVLEEHRVISVVPFDRVAYAMRFRLARDTAAKPQPQVGQTWRSRDPRDRGVVAKVEAVEEERVQIRRFRKSWVRLNRFHRDYELIGGSA